MDNTFYTCPYCNEEYTIPSDLAHCILSCEDKKKREEEERRKAELALEKETRRKEVIDAYKHFEKLRSDYLKDYGWVTIETESTNKDSHSWFWNTIGVL